jgi:hypothetical protein
MMFLVWFLGQTGLNAEAVAKVRQSMGALTTSQRA